MAESIANGALIRTHLNIVAAAAIEMMIIMGPPYMNKLACQSGKADRLRVSMPTPVMTEIARRIDTIRRTISTQEFCFESMSNGGRCRYFWILARFPSNQ